MRHRRAQQGLTLVEVMISVVIIAVTLLMLLERRTAALQEASEIRRERMAWVLAATKMAEIAIDPENFTGDGENGDEGAFEGEEYRFAAVIEKREEATNDPEKTDEKPKEIFFVRLTVSGAEAEEGTGLVLEAYFPKIEESSEIPR